MAYTQDQINAALVAELEARPGTTYNDMMAHAMSTYGLSPSQVDAAYNAMSSGGNTVLQNTGAPLAPGALHVEPGTVFNDRWWPTGPVADPSAPPGTVRPTTQVPPPPPLLNGGGSSGAGGVGQIPRQDAVLNAGNGPSTLPNWQARQTVGSAGSSMLGAGNADYGSELIKNLRIASAQPRSNNPGVAMIPNGAAAPGAAPVMGPSASPAPAPNAFNPGLQDLEEWDPTPIFNEIYGRDPTAEELRGTRFLSEKDLRTSLNYWWNLYQKQQNQPDAPAPAPAPMAWESTGGP